MAQSSLKLGSLSIRISACRHLPACEETKHAAGAWALNAEGVPGLSFQPRPL